MRTEGSEEYSLGIEAQPIILYTYLVTGYCLVQVDVRGSVTFSKRLPGHAARSVGKS